MNRYVLIGIGLFFLGFFLTPFLIGIPIMIAGWFLGTFGFFYGYYCLIPGHENLTKKIKDYWRRYIEESALLTYFFKTRKEKKKS